MRLEDKVLLIGSAPWALLVHIDQGVGIAGLIIQIITVVVYFASGAWRLEG